MNRWRNYPDSITDDINKFAENIDRYIVDDVRHKSTQYDFVNIDGQIVCDIYKYEDGLDNVIRVVSEKIHNHHIVGGVGVGGERGSRFPIMTKMNRYEHGQTRNDRRPVHEVLNESTMRFVEQRYADDFRMFDYEMISEYERNRMKTNQGYMQISKTGSER